MITSRYLPACNTPCHAATVHPARALPLSLYLFLFNFRSTLQTLSRFRYQLLNRSVGEYVGRVGTATIPFVDRIDGWARWSLTGVVRQSKIKKSRIFNEYCENDIALYISPAKFRRERLMFSLFKRIRRSR